MKWNMAEQWVVNASPLIVLAKIGKLDLLVQLADEVVVPRAVVQEIQAGPEDDPARVFLSSAPFPVVDVPAHPIILGWDLGKGETSVLSYAFMHAEWKVVIDDGAARRCARTLGIPMIGTLGIILRARKLGYIPAAAPLLQALKARGFRLNDGVIREALRATVGEDWDG